MTWNVQSGSDTYAPNGKITTSDGKDFEMNPILNSLALGASYNNRARCEYSNADKKWKRIGEPTEVALLAVAEKIMGNGNNKNFDYNATCTKSYSTKIQLDFTSKRKCMSTVISSGSTLTTLLKGAPDRVLDKCTSVKHLNGTEKMSKEVRDSIEKEIDDLSHQGLRVLAFAEIEGAGALKNINPDDKAL
jgi:magnesium-transporting ATPase (P-type)